MAGKFLRKLMEAQDKAIMKRSHGIPYHIVSEIFEEMRKAFPDQDVGDEFDYIEAVNRFYIEWMSVDEG